MATLNVKVVPGARQDRVVGPYGDNAVKVQVSAPPEGGKANDAVILVLAEALGLKRGQVRIISGHAQPRKVVEIDGLSDSDARSRLGLPSA